MGRQGVEPGAPSLLDLLTTQLLEHATGHGQGPLPLEAALRGFVLGRGELEGVFGGFPIQGEHSLAASALDGLLAAMLIGEESLETCQEKRTEASSGWIGRRHDVLFEQPGEEVLHRVLGVLWLCQAAAGEAVQWRPVRLAKLRQGLPTRLVAGGLGGQGDDAPSRRTQRGPAIVLGVLHGPPWPGCCSKDRRSDQENF